MMYLRLQVIKIMFICFDIKKLTLKQWRKKSTRNWNSINKVG